MNRLVVVCVASAVTFGGWCETQAQDESSPSTAVNAEELKAELDAFRTGLFQAFNEGKYQEMLDEFCHKDIITMWQDGTSARGHAGVLAEFEKLGKFIDKMEVQPDTEERTILNGGKMVISTGNMKDKYALSRGMSVELKSKWTATLVKVDGKWLMVSFSASANSFDNEVVSLYLTSTKLWSAGTAGVIGLAIGIVVARVFLKKRPPKTHPE